MCEVCILRSIQTFAIYFTATCTKHEKRVQIGAVTFPTAPCSAVAGFFIKGPKVSEATGTHSDLISYLFLDKKERIMSH